MAKEKKNPWISAILNFILWGLGYLYNGQRVRLGIGLAIGDIIMFFGGFISGLGSSSSSGPIGTIGLLIALFGNLILGLTFAYDGYKEAKEITRKK